MQIWSHLKNTILRHFYCYLVIIITLLTLSIIVPWFTKCLNKRKQLIKTSLLRRDLKYDTKFCESFSSGKIFLKCPDTTKVSFGFKPRPWNNQVPIRIWACRVAYVGVNSSETQLGARVMHALKIICQILKSILETLSCLHEEKLKRGDVM